MNNSNDKFISYFGIFTLNALANQDVEWNRVHRIEFHNPNNNTGNWIGAMKLYGRTSMQIGDLSICELTPLTQSNFQDFEEGMTLKLKRGSFEFGELRVLYYDDCTEFTRQ